jgi:hypothetical protein
MGTCIAKEYNNCFGDELFKDNDGKDYCILHAPLQVREKYNLNERFVQILNHKRSKKEFDYSGCEFDPHTAFYYSGGKDEKLILRNSKFHHKLDLSNRNLGFSDFSGAAFEEELDFENTAFYNKTIFEKVKFNKFVHFNNCIFYKELLLSDSPNPLPSRERELLRMFYRQIWEYSNSCKFLFILNYDFRIRISGRNRQPLFFK